MSHDKTFIDDAVAEALAAIEPTIRAAITKAAEKAGERSRNAIAEAQRALSVVMGDEPSAPPQPPLLASWPEQPKPNPAPTGGVRQRLTVIKKKNPPRANGGYSGVAIALRRALDDIGRADSAISVEDLRRHIAANGYGPANLTTQQLRSGISGLVQGEEATRIDRGLYRAGPKLMAQLKEAAE